MTSLQTKNAVGLAAQGTSSPRSRWTSSRLFFFGLTVLAGISLAGYFVLSETFGGDGAGSAKTQLAAIPFDGAQAYEYLKKLCEIGPRPSGSPGMAAQQKLLIDYFQKLGATVTKQEFRARHPLTGEAVPMTNLLIQWHPDRKERVLLCVHYDTRPFPDRDRRNPKGTFIGANDGASGVALLMELGKSMPKFQSRYGVDFLLVDGEDLVFWDQATERDTGSYCVGSEYFGRMYVAEPPAYKYRCAVVFDMIAGTNLRLPKELNSVAWPDSKPFVNEIWDIAARLKVKEFAPFANLYPILDDHVKLHDVGRIPACDIICDFNADYRQWHTEADDPAHCSALSLAKVGWVVLEWLKSLK
jgi:glutaminyl-peptide cyclotransferase